jgi:hypothetical protein
VASGSSRSPIRFYGEHGNVWWLTEWFLTGVGGFSRGLHLKTLKSQETKEKIVLRHQLLA